MTPLSFTKTTMFHILVIFRSLLLPRAQSMVSRCLKSHKMFLFTTEKPILRWNFFPSSEMVFSRSIWDLKWLLTTRACEGWFATTRGPRQTKRKPFHYAVKNSRVKLVFWLGMELCSTEREIVKLFECLELKKFKFAKKFACFQA